MPIWDHQISFDVEFHLMCSSFFVLTFCHIQLEVSCHPWKCRKWIPSQTLDETSSWFMDYSACKSSRVPRNWLKKYILTKIRLFFPEKNPSRLYGRLGPLPGLFCLWSQCETSTAWGCENYTEGGLEALWIMLLGAHHLSPRLLEFRRDMIC